MVRMPRKGLDKGLEAKAVGGFILILTLAMIALPIISSIAQAQIQRDIGLTIMLEKVRASVVLIITIPRAIIIWEDFIPNLREVGLPPALETSSPAFGSGFIVSPDGYIITNGHVVNDFKSELEKVRPLLLDYVEQYADAYEKASGQQLSQEDINGLYMDIIRAYLTNKLKIQDYRVDVYVGVGRVVSGFANIGKLYTARIVASTPFENEDLALLKVEIKNAPSIQVASEDIARIGERVWALGYPGAVTFHELLGVETLLEPTITEGTVSGYRMKASGVRVLQSDVSVTHGSSGGPVVNSQGVVVAVTSFGSADPTGSGREVPGFNFFVPASLVNEMIRRNNVNNVESTTMKLYGEGLQLYYNKQYRAAIDRFQTLKNLYPGFPFVDDYIANAQQAILRGEERQQFPVDPSILVAIVIAGGVGGGVGYMMLRRRNSRAREYRAYRDVEHGRGYGAPPSGVGSPPPQQPQQGVQPSSGAGTLGGAPPGYKYCIGCGKLIPSESTKCPYCGVEQ
ncbi:MAG: trypsin-like peptidase domain-containing protein [Fervidicoccaceae archaeon]